MIHFASYHFVSPFEAYISYESDACADFDVLDDGTRVPARQAFEGTSYDASTRTFRGTVNWAPTSWNGWQLWDFEMVFSEDLSRIAGGKVKTFAPGAGVDAEP